MNQVEGCGEIVHKIARKEFFSILTQAAQRLKKATSDDSIMPILDIFYWQYSSEDLQELANTRIFNVLHEGDGTLFNPLRRAWGHRLYYSYDDQYNSVTRGVITIFSFLFKTVLKSIVNEDTVFNVSEDVSHSVVNVRERSKTNLVRSSESVL